jgi:hypothetical protein
MNKSDQVKCAKCQNVWHIACTSLSSFSGDSLKKRISSWLCTTCDAAKLGIKKTVLSAPSNIDYVSKIDSILAAVTEIKTILSKHEQIFGKLNRKIDDFSNQLRDLGVRTTLLEDKVTLIETRLSKLESMNTLTDNNIISEVSDKQLRCINMILFNVPESDDNTSANDSSIIKSIFDSLSIVMTPTAVNRLGRKSTKPRPLKIILQDASDVFVVLKNKHKLRSIPTYSSVRISPDRTQMQRDQLRNVYDKFEERKAAGETDLIVKFLKGIPTISKNS